MKMTGAGRIFVSGIDFWEISWTEPTVEITFLRTSNPLVDGDRFHGSRMSAPSGSSRGQAAPSAEADANPKRPPFPPHIQKGGREDVSKLGKLITGADSLVRCTVCGYEEWVHFATCLRSGWPKCHGYTMRLESHPDISKATTEALSQ